MVKITWVRFEHHEENTIGIGESAPHISWSFEGNEKNWKQVSYELEITRSTGEIETWAVESEQSSLVPWIGAPLGSGEKAAVRIRVFGNDGKRGEWSEKGVVEAGLLNREDWKCKLIEPGNRLVPGSPHRTVVFRRVVNVENAVAEARLYITAHGVYEARINGRKVGDHVLAPGWTSYKHRVAYQTFDVTEYLVVGENVLEIDVAEG